MVSVRSSDRSLEGGTLQELWRADVDPLAGYAPFVKHGIIGQGLIDYGPIFGILASVDFSDWVSIADGQDPTDGMKELASRRCSCAPRWNSTGSHSRVFSRWGRIHDESNCPYLEATGPLQR